MRLSAVTLLKSGVFAIRTRILEAAGVAAALAATLLLHPARAAEAEADAEQALRPALATSDAVARVTRWVAAEGDNGSLPYIVIDKQAAAMLLFDGSGKLLGETPVLIGIGVGDESSPGIGGKTLGEIGPAERTTPAGRFVARLGTAVGWKSVLWVDYADSVALHAVVKDIKKDKRPERLKSPTPDDNRITFGCINIDTAFYLKQVKPAFKKGGLVYILPDTKPLEEVFPRVRLLPYLEADAPPPATIES